MREIEFKMERQGLVQTGDEVEIIRQLYIESIVKLTGENSRKLFEEKIKGTGSPKIEKIRSMSKDEIAVPDTWRNI